MNTTPYQEALGLALNDAAAANKLIDLDVGDFEAEQDKEIFAAIKTLKTERKPATIVTVDTELGGRHTAYMIDITSSAYLPSLIDTYISAIRDKSKRRKIKQADMCWMYVWNWHLAQRKYIKMRKSYYSQA